MVEELVPTCIQEFQEFVKQELEIEWPLEVEVENKVYLQLRKLEDLQDSHGRGLLKSEEDKKW